MACWLGSQVRQNYQTIFWLYRATGSGLKMVRTTAGISVRVTLQAEMGFTEIWGLVAVNSVLLHFPSVFSFSQWSLWGKTCVGLLGNVLLCWGSRYPPWVLSRSLSLFFFFPIGEAVGLVGLLCTAPCYSGGDVMRWLNKFSSCTSIEVLLSLCG